MSRTIAAEMLEKFASSQYIPAFFFEFNQDETTYKWTSLDVDYNIPNGVSTTTSGLFTSIGFTFDSLSYSTGNIVDDAQIRLSNLDSVQTAIFVENDMQGETARIYAAVIDEADYSLVGDVILLLFEGEIDSFELYEDEIQLKIGSIFSKWNHKAAALHSASCRWRKFKGTRCTYSGNETTCDRSYNRCAELGNTANFGGFRFLPQLMNRTLHWGPTQTEFQESGGK